MSNQKQLFGTNGVRGVIGETMTPELVLKIGAALGTLRKGRIAVGRDTRTSGEALVHAVKAGLLMVGCDVVDLGVLPTPALQYIVRRHFDGGAVITASHNPPEYNGVKIIDADGTEMSDEDTIAVENLYFSGTFAGSSWDRVGSEVVAHHMVEEYIQGIVDLFPPGIGTGMTVVVDPGSGPAALTTPLILSRMGCRVHTINAQMDGTFPGRLPEPTPEGLAGLSEMVKSLGADYGVAHDGDADRAVFVDDKGQYVEENHEFALITDYVCKQRKGIVVTPVSTSRIIEDVAGANGCSTEYTPVGSIYVARRMLGLIEDGVSVAFGGEGNGGLIYPDHQFCRDGGMTAATMVAVLASRQGEKLSTVLGGLPAYHFIKEKQMTPEPAAIVRAVDAAFPDDRKDRTDGIKIVREDAWALVRASGTEPMVRIMVESRDKTVAETLYRSIRQVIGTG